MVRILKHAYKLWLWVWFSIYDHLSIVGTTASKFVKQSGCYKDIGNEIACVYEKRVVRKSGFVVQN